jgi:hypothetical protein
MSRRWRLLASCVLLLFLLAGCYLVSGERVDTMPMTETRPGVYTVRFVSADGQAYRDVQTGMANVPVIVDVSSQTQQGELIIAVLDVYSSPEFTVTARYGLQGQGNGVIRTDDEGRITLRIGATEARSGAYTVRFRLQVPPTPTPTSPPTPAPLGDGESQITDRVSQITSLRVRAEPAAGR